MNKGLEVIEAHYLFGVPYERIEVVFHPQSIIHSMVEFRDGAIIAQLGLPDMRLPISFALSYPERWGPGWVRTSIPSLGSLTFEEADMETFKCLRLAYEAGEMGGTATTVLNVADEVAVDAFLKGKIRFLEIGDIVECVLHEHSSEPVLSLEQIRKVEAESRAQALRLVDEMGGL
jgi:1-deoxy-D-xylulose-5-phosphate reductoisomerase